AGARKIPAHWNPSDRASRGGPAWGGCSGWAWGLTSWSHTCVRSCDRFCPPPACTDTTAGAAMLVHAQTCPAPRHWAAHRNGAPDRPVARANQALRTPGSRGSVSVLAGPLQAPVTATTPCVVPTSTSGPDSDGEAAPGSGLPRLIWCLMCPVVGLSWYSTPVVQSGTHTTPPPTTGEPWAPPGPRQSTWIWSCAVFTAAIPPEKHGT